MNKKSVSMDRILLSFFALPFVVIIIIPLALSLLLPIYLAQPFLAFRARFIFAAPVVLGGVFLIIKTNLLFIYFGGGTLAPWDPPVLFVIRGPYRYMRHPMILGVLMVLLGEVFLLGFSASFVWFFTFLVINLFYIPLSEEKVLCRRFGGAYHNYKENVPAWIPRLVPWVSDS